ncbi:MAG: D-3-phosphoglycerate dehydrogenase / 2-oxoglutarate reductase [Solirubrobacteraceae bacterium]|jgi:D-3-phosphoglycerate dehydrogenase|nr:D-3-phosphoglycerate dehydrogenase / 2-oxoglutarate reductase [Solirubrobacteraceae bacterium]MEA2186025.1 D-3-phosphoglycerate dehydrogenase / 2-oxoglutarate reductase [Solirubrobacteraceae bacterium]
MSSDRVLITCRQMQNCIDEFRPRLEAAQLDLVLPDVVQQPSEEELIAIIGDFDGMIAGDDPLSMAVLQRARRMRIISKWGVGIDGIDLEAAKRLGIKVANTPGVFGEEVADVGIGYVIMLARQLHRIHSSVAGGGWWKHEGRSLCGATLGVAGLGSIGQAVARRGKCFGMQVLAHDPGAVAREAAEAAGIDLLDVEDLFRRSDFLVLCCPLTAENRHMVNASRLELMKAGSYVVNVARGPLVDESALVRALESGRLSAAALDVFEHEPLPADHPLRRFPQCIFGSHNGSNTREGVLRASAKAVDNLLAGLKLS